MNRHFQPFPPLPPCPPETCRCDRCRAPAEPCKPFPPHSFLLPRILACGRVWLRRTPFCLKLTCVDPCAQPPYTLVSAEPTGAPPCWETRPAPPCHMGLHVWIPLLCRLRDGCGNVFTGEATIEADLTLRLTMPQAECWRDTLVVLPCVRLVCAQPADTLCIDAQLEVLAEAYLTRWEPCLAGVPKPVSPNGC